MKKTNPRIAKAALKFSNARENKAFLRTLARMLEKPSRQIADINVAKIDKLCRQGEDVVVPGKVLGSGEIKKAVNVYAAGFSSQAEEKIKKAGGKCIEIEKLAETRKPARIIT